MTTSSDTNPAAGLDLADPDRIRYGVEEVSESLNYFDEIAIEKHFGKDWTDLAATITLRALAFILERRAGLTDRDAFAKVAQLPLVAVNAYFDLDAAEVPEVAPDEDPDLLDAVGKDDATPPQPPTNWPPSVS